MLIYLALSERTAPLGGIHDVFIKDAISEHRSSCKGRSRRAFHFSLMPSYKSFFFFFLETFCNTIRGKWAVERHRGTSWTLAKEDRVVV